MIKSYKVMLLPNNKQKTRLHETSDSARYAYNWTVGKQKEAFEQTGRYISEREIRKQFTLHKADKSWLYGYSNNATKQAIRDACDAFWRFLSEKKKDDYKPYTKKQIANTARNGRTLTRYDMQGHPKFKKKGHAKPGFYVDTWKIKITETHVKLEGIAESKRKNRAKANYIRLAECGRIPQGVSYINPRCTFDGIHWWISVGVETETHDIQKSVNDGVGVDVGLKDLLIDSNGNRVQNMNQTQAVKRLEQKQRRLRRGISRKYILNKKGEHYCKTRNIIRAENQLLRMNHRLTGIRYNHVHQTTASLVKQKPRFICAEDLNVQGMMKNKHVARAIQEQCLYELFRQLQYKASWNGITFISAPRFYPSSKTCSRCGNVKQDLKLSDRTYICEECGLTIDRDYNAAINLREYGRIAAA